MLTRGILAFLFLFIASVLAFSACDVISEKGLEDSLAPFIELEEVTGATNTNFTINKGESNGFDSFFTFEIGNSGENSIVPKRVAEGWCIEWDKPISSNGESYSDIPLYSTFGSNSWKPANYLMSIADDLRANDPAVTYREIQVALWSVIENPRFDMDNAISSGNMPSRLMDNGNPNFSVDKVREIVEKVRAGSKDFNYSTNDTYLLLSNKGDLQNGGTPVKCGSFRTQTPGGWGSPPAGNNPGKYLDDNFDKAFPDGIIIGGSFTATFTSAEAIRNFMPSGGTPSALLEDITNPTIALGTLAGHVLAIELAVGFELYDENFSNSTFMLTQLIVKDGKFAGKTIEEILAEANRVLGGGTVGDYTAGELNGILSAVANAFTDGDVKVKDQDVVKCPTNSIELL